MQTQDGKARKVFAELAAAAATATVPGRFTRTDTAGAGGAAGSGSTKTVLSAGETKAEIDALLGPDTRESPAGALQRAETAYGEYTRLNPEGARSWFRKNGWVPNDAHEARAGRPMHRLAGRMSRDLEAGYSGDRYRRGGPVDRRMRAIATDLEQRLVDECGCTVVVAPNGGPVPESCRYGRPTAEAGSGPGTAQIAYWIAPETPRTADAAREPGRAGGGETGVTA